MAEGKRLNFFQRKRLEREEKKLGKRRQAEARKRDESLPKIAPKGIYVSLQKLNKIYDNSFHAVHDFSIDIKQHEFIVFVGPSGCGKSTTLRMVAGLEDISSGNLFIDGEYMNDVSPKDRGIAMVFQSYALYPHMTVYENMAYPLKIMHLSRKEINDRVMHAAQILQITDLLDRKPRALSGGQRQRVALGRAIVKHSKVLLMDEPLSNLDAKLRVQMRGEIVNLHNTLNATTIYVTHDQTEAMTMATRIVIMKNGYIQQIGTPIEIYNHPFNLFVATFIGSPSMNILDATYDNGSVILPYGEKISLDPKVREIHDDFFKASEEQNREKTAELQAELDDWEKKKEPEVFAKEKNEEIDRIKKELASANEEETFNRNALLGPHKIKVGIRPERVEISGGEADNLYPDAKVNLYVRLAELVGNEYYVHAPFNGIDLVVRLPSEHPIKIGDKITINLNPRHFHLFNPLTSKCII